MNKTKYTHLQLDFIKELASVGGGSSATSISRLINKPVNMAVPTIDILDYNEVFDGVMAEDQMVNAVIIRMLGDAEGTFLFVSTKEASIDLVNMMVPASVQLTEELGVSAIKELVNTLVTSFLNAVSKMIKVDLISSVPLLTMDMFGAILSSVYIESEQYDESIMIIKNEFFYQGDIMEISLYFVPKPGVLENLFKTIGV